MITTSIGHPDGDDATGALLAARGRRRETDAAEGVAVRRARTSGLSWGEIASLLGSSRRTVRTRYGGSMFSR